MKVLHHTELIGPHNKNKGRPAPHWVCWLMYLGQGQNLGFSCDLSVITGTTVLLMVMVIFWELLFKMLHKDRCLDPGNYSEGQPSPILGPSQRISTVTDPFLKVYCWLKPWIYLALFYKQVTYFLQLLLTFIMKCRLHIPELANTAYAAFPSSSSVNRDYYIIYISHIWIRTIGRILNAACKVMAI